MAVVDYIYKNKPYIFRTTIGEGTTVVDITNLITQISGLSSELDVTVPTSFQRPSVTLTLRDDGVWNPHNEENGFTGPKLDADGNAVPQFPMYNATGYLAPITIKTGYELEDGTEETEIAFKGLIEDIDQDIKPGHLVISFSDESISLRKDKIEDFGLQKYLTLEKGNGRLNGEYPLPRIMAPMSAESFSGDNLNVVEALKSEGDLDPTNVKPSPEKLETEGDFLSTDPGVSFKSPFRWKRIDKIVERILEEYNITNPIIELDDTILDEKIPATYGRVGYEVEKTQQSDKDSVFRWTGYVTDWIVDGDDAYFLYSARGERPRLLKYEDSTDTWSQIIRRSSNAEWWKLVKHNDDFYVLGTTGLNNPETPVLGVYDPTENNPTAIIERISGTTISTHVSSNVLLKPIGAAFYYHFGFDPGGDLSELRKGIRPDSRKGFQIYNSELYYLYANSLGFGIAKTGIGSGSTTPTAVVQMPHIGRWSHLSHDFLIVGSQLLGGVCFQKGDRSQIQVFRKQV